MPADPRAAVLRLAFLAVLAAIAVVRRGPPAPPTLLAMAALLLAFVAMRLIALRTRRLPRELRPAAIALAALVAVVTAQWLLGARGELRLSWLTLLGVPLALALTVPGGGLVPRSRALSGLFFVTIALGLVAMEPWEDRVGRVLLGALALIGVVASVLDTGRTLAAPGLPPPPAATRRRAAATAALLAVLVLLSSIGVDAALAPIPRKWRDPPEKREEDPLAQRVQRRDLPAEDAAGEVALALVRVVDEDVDAGAIPERLYLLERVLDEPVKIDDLLYVGPRSAPSTVHRDDEDGSEDLRVRWPEAPSEPASEGLTFQVTLLAEVAPALLVVPAPRWIEGRSLTFGGDLAIARPPAGAGSFSYRTAGDPRAAFDAPSTGTRVAARDPRRVELPATFAGRGALEQLAAELSTGQADDFAKARALATHLRRTGRVDASVPFRGWEEFLAARTGSPLHFAQCFVLLARLARIPARVAAGYCSDDWHEADRRFEVRVKDEHYWGEVELEELGWVDFDPCPELPAYDPDAAAAGVVPPETTDPKAVRKALARERPLVVGLILLLLIAAFLAFPSLRMGLEKLVGPRAPAGLGGTAKRAWRYWQELIDCCRRFGLVAHPAWTAEEFARVVGSAAPAERPGLLTLLRVYHACRFGGADLSPAEEQGSKELLARLPRSLSEWRSRARAAAPSTR